MSNYNAHISRPDGIIVFTGGKQYTVDNTHPNYEAIKTAVKSGEWKDIPDLVDLAASVAKYALTNNDVLVDVAKSMIFYKGEAIHNSLVSRIFDMMKEGFVIEPMTNLLSNLYQNVSMKAIDELYDFLEYGKMPITEDGHFLAYKRVNNNYTSVYDGKTTNNIGEVTSLPRYKVDDRSEVTCSYGLHVCSFEYLKNYPGDRVIVVKVNPADVVSIPRDYNNTKARVCRYEVIGELTYEEAGLSSHSFGTSVYVEEPKAPEQVDASTQEAINAMENMVDNLNMRDVKDLFELSITGQLTDDDLTQAFLKSKLNELMQQPPPEPKPAAKVDTVEIINMIDDMFGVAFGTQTETSTNETPEIDEAPVSEWFKYGYTNGYHDGKMKNTIAPDASLEDDETGTMTLQDIIDVNVGYSTGYKDGRGHKSKQYPKTKMPIA